VTALLDSQADRRDSGGPEAAKRRLLDAEARIRRFQDAIASGIDPAALVDALDCPKLNSLGWMRTSVEANDCPLASVFRAPSRQEVIVCS
jgi:hypothetical protein